MTAGWLVAIGLVLVSATWLGLFSFKGVMSRHSFEWLLGYFAVHSGDQVGEAARCLRGLVGVLVLLLGVVVWRLLRPVKPAPGIPGSSELAAA